MLARVAAFEIRFLVRSPLFWIASAIFFLLSFASVAVEGVSIGGRGLTHLNSPFALVQTVGVMAVFGVFVVVAFVAGAVVRDDETGFAPIVHTTRVTKPAYVVGRFLGATAVGYLVLCSVALGVLVGTWMPWLDPDKLGPFRAGDYLHVLLVLLLPTVLLLSAGFFALATGTRSMTTTYVGAVGFLALYFAAIIGLQDPRWLDLVALLDPFGLGAAEAMTRYWTTAERNTQLLPLAGPLLRNRLLWGAITVVLFAVAYRLFRFEAKPAGGGKAEGGEPADAHLVASRPLIPSPSTSFTLSVAAAGGEVEGPRVNEAEGRAQGAWSALLTLARFDALFVLRSPAFYVLLALGVLNAFASLFTSTDFMGAELLPVTRGMVRALDGAFSLFPLLIAIYYAGELVWRDRERRVHEIVDATPAPDWTFLVPKLVAVTGVLAATVLVGVLTAVGTQLLKGWTTLELGHYLLWFAVPTVIALFLFAVFAVFVQSIVASKPLGWAAMLVYVVVMSSLSKAGFQHPLYRWSSTTPTPLSDMNGLGRFWVGAAWLQLYWLLLSVAVLVLAHALRRRGTEARLTPRLRALPRRLRGAPGVLAALALAGAAVAGGWVFFNTNVLNTYRSDDDEEARQALVEKTLSPFEKVPQPTITDVKLDVQLFPREVRAVTRGEYAIENRTGAPLDHVHVRWDLRLRLDELTVERGAVEQELPDVHCRIFRLSPPMAPGERRRIAFATTLEERGFPARQPLTRVVGNGTFLDNTEIAPSLGWWRGEGLLTDRAKRRKYGLPELPRMAKLEDPAARAHHYLRHDSDWVNAELSLTTDADQVPVLPGYTVEETTRGGRRTLRTRTEAPIHHFFSLQSARYAAKVQRVGAVETAVLHHPPHGYTLDRMLGSMRRSLELFGRAFSPFQFRQLRVLEFPAYASFAQSFSNTIPYSEAIGFVADASDPEKVDLATYVTAHEVAHQWFGHQNRRRRHAGRDHARRDLRAVRRAPRDGGPLREGAAAALHEVRARPLPALARERARGGAAARPRREPGLHPLPEGHARHGLARRGRRARGRDPLAPPARLGVRLQAGALPVLHRLPPDPPRGGRPRARRAHHRPLRADHALRPRRQGREGDPPARRQVRGRALDHRREEVRRREGCRDRGADGRARGGGRLRGRAREEGLPRGGRAPAREGAGEERGVDPHARRRPRAALGGRRPVQPAHRPQLRRQPREGRVAAAAVRRRLSRPASASACATAS
ncbi:MAG: hypothetical protein QM704_06640 [Anaeromyxobacteraceae bacterium]